MVLMSRIRDFLSYGLPLKATRIRTPDELADILDVSNYCDITIFTEEHHRKYAHRTDSLYLLCPKDTPHNPWLIIRRACLSEDWVCVGNGGLHTRTLDFSGAWYNIMQGQKVKEFLTKKLDFFIKTGQDENSKRAEKMLEHFGVAGSV